MKPDLLRISCPLSRVSVLVFLWISLTGAELKSGEMLYPQAVSYRAEGRRLQQMGQNQEAVAAFRKAVLAHPSYADAYNDLGVALEEVGELKEAEEAYKTALTFNPDLMAAHSNLALLYERTGRISEATPHWTARVKGAPAEDPWALKARAKLIRYNLPVPMPPPESVKREPQVNFTHRTKAQEDRPPVPAKIREPKPKAEEPKREEERKPLAPAPVARGQMRKEEQAQAQRDRAARLRAEERAARVRAEEIAQRQADELRQHRSEEQKRSEEARRMAQAEAIRRAKETAVIQRAAPPASEPTTAPAPMPKEKQQDARSIVEETIREKRQARLTTTRELYQRGVAAMRQLRYEEAITHFQQVLILEPDHTEAKQGLKRAQTALMKATQTRR